MSAEQKSPGAFEWRKLAARALYRSGAVRLMRTAAQSFVFQRTASQKRPSLRRSSVPRLAILSYHRVGTGGIPFYSELPAQTFEEQMRYLRKNYRVLSLDEMLLEMADPKSLEPAVTVTFDDGYRGLFSEAFPVLQKYQIPATIFLTVGCIESGEVAWYDRVFLALQVAPSRSLELDLAGPVNFSLISSESRMQAAVEIISRLRTFSPELRARCCAALESKVRLPDDELQDRMLTWDQIRLMFCGGVFFGAHTMTHPVASRLSGADLDWQIRESKKRIEEQLGSPVRHFAFPFGKREECGEAATAALVSAGYHSAATTEWGLNSTGTDPFRLRRVQIGEMGSQAMFAFQLARLFLVPILEPHGAGQVNSSEARPEAEVQAQQVGR